MLSTNRSLHDFIDLENEHPGWHLAFQAISAQAMSLNSQITIFDGEMIDGDFSA